MIETNLQNCLRAVIDNRGVTPHKKGTEWQDSGIPVLSANNIKTSGLQKLDEVRYIPEEVYPSWMKIPLEKGDIILTSEAPAGEVYYWDSDEKVVLGQRLYGLKVKEEINSKFLKYYLQSSVGQKAIQGQNSGSTVFGIAAATFPFIKVNLLERIEQDLVAELLYAIDSKIFNNTVVCSVLKDIAKLLYDYWFVQFDYPDKNGKPYRSSGGKMVWNERLKRNIPEGWEVKSLSECCAFENGDRSSNYPNGADFISEGIPFVTGGALSTYDIDYNEIRFISKEKFHSLRAGKAKKGDILMTLRGSLAKCVYSPFDDMAIASALVIVRPINGNRVQYLHRVLISDYYFRLLENYDNGSVQANISVDVLKTFPFLIPSAEILSNFSNYIKQIEDQESMLREENHKLTALRDFLLPLLMNGQVSVVSS